MNLEDLETNEKDLCKLCLYPYHGNCPAKYFHVERYGFGAPKNMIDIINQCDVVSIDRTIYKGDMSMVLIHEKYLEDHPEHYNEIPIPKEFL